MLLDLSFLVSNDFEWIVKSEHLLIKFIKYVLYINF